MSLDVVFVDATGVPVMETSFVLDSQLAEAVPVTGVAGDLELNFQSPAVAVDFLGAPIDSIDVSPVIDGGSGKTLTLVFSTPTFEAEVMPIYTGKSAYDVAVLNGFNGTQQEWLESLRNDANIIGSEVTDADVVEDWDAA